MGSKRPYREKSPNRDTGRERERETSESDVGRRGNEEGVSEGKGRKRRWGSSDTGNGERERGRESALDGWGGVEGGIRARAAWALK